MTSTLFETLGKLFIDAFFRNEFKLTKKMISLRIEEDLSDKCDSISKAHDISRSEAISVLLEYVINDVYHHIPNFKYSSLRLRARLVLSSKRKANQDEVINECISEL